MQMKRVEVNQSQNHFSKHKTIINTDFAKSEVNQEGKNSHQDNVTGKKNGMETK